MVRNQKNFKKKQFGGNNLPIYEEDNLICKPGHQYDKNTLGNEYYVTYKDQSYIYHKFKQSIIDQVIGYINKYEGQFNNVLSDPKFSGPCAFISNPESNPESPHICGILEKQIDNLVNIDLTKINICDFLNIYKSIIECAHKQSKYINDKGDILFPNEFSNINIYDNMPDINKYKNIVLIGFKEYTIKSQTDFINKLTKQIFSNFLGTKFENNHIFKKLFVIGDSDGLELKKQDYLFDYLLNDLDYYIKMAELTPYYPTNYEVDPETKIIAFSDVHSDIHSLIIALRDCAQVIQKKKIFTFESLADPLADPLAKATIKPVDNELERLLNIDLNTDEIDYLELLNYEWVPGNKTHVVIIGDIIDGNRSINPITIDKNGKQKQAHEYPQIELKILKFINGINKEAMRNKGRIFKLLGNHEVINIDPQTKDTAQYYAFPDDIANKNYYQEFERHQIFYSGNPGYKLLFEDGCGALLKILNYIFVHGEILTDKDYTYYNDINQTINNPKPTIDQLRSVWTDLNNEQTSQLWKRTYGFDFNNTDPNNPKQTRLNNSSVQTHFCEHTVPANFTSFLKKSYLNDKPDDLKIVIGHCTQYDYTTGNFVNSTFNQTESQDAVKEVLVGPPARNVQPDPTTNTIFGITMECPVNGNENSSKIFKVDVGSSRGFDWNYDFLYNVKNPDDILNEEKKFFARTPQVLEIQNNNEKIIRSRIKNTRIHQPRQEYEQIIDNLVINPLKLDSRNYENKYLKYKNKYLQLKKIKNK